MSKYDEFIENLKEEINNINIPNQSSYIKSNVQLKNSKKSFFNFRFFSLSTCAALVIITLILTMIFIKKESAVEPTPTIKVPTIASTIDDAYAFEIMAAGNFLYTKTTNQATRGRKNAKKTADSELKEITDRIHDHYLTVKQLLVKDKITYKIEDTVDDAYKNKMIIQPFFNSNFDLEYTIYFNKTKTIIEDEEELFDFEGIIIINNMTYQIEGKIETDEDFAKVLDEKLKMLDGLINLDEIKSEGSNHSEGKLNEIALKYQNTCEAVENKLNKYVNDFNEFFYKEIFQNFFLQLKKLIDEKYEKYIEISVNYHSQIKENEFLIDPDSPSEYQEAIKQSIELLKEDQEHQIGIIEFQYNSLITQKISDFKRTSFKSNVGLQ